MTEIEKNRKEIYSDYKQSIFFSYIKKETIKARKAFFSHFVNNTDYTNNKSVIDIGTTPSLDEEHNIFLTNTKNNKNISCLSDQDCSILKKKYKNIKKIFTGYGQNTGLEDNSFDIVHSNAVIEHVGSYENQLSFIKEITRISKKYIFIQTPNRNYPIEFHTILPFIHMFSKNIHRKILKLLGLEFYSKEENLNLLTKKDLINICEQLNLKKFKILEHKLFFLTSHLMLVIEK